MGQHILLFYRCIFELFPTIKNISTMIRFVGTHFLFVTVLFKEYNYGFVIFILLSICSILNRSRFSTFSNKFFAFSLFSCCLKLVPYERICFNMFKDEGQKRIGNQSNILITNRMSVRYFLVSGKTLIICRQAVCVCVYNTTYIVRTTPLER